MLLGQTETILERQNDLQIVYHDRRRAIEWRNIHRVNGIAKCGMLLETRPLALLNLTRARSVFLLSPLAPSRALYDFALAAMNMSFL